MIRPHEQKWTTKIVPYGRGTRALVVNSAGRTVAHVPAFDPQATVERDGNATLLAAAPAMARALLSDGHWRGGMWHAHHCTAYNVPDNCPERCAKAREALKAAGVLP